ncbi:glutamate-5-semialdehyde dehydrogenase [Campylobacter sp. MIT 21-1685]|uniref:glutamate-5-semialdehyde dehydrogenase n=1 Tax=unclassified Campylobacter TaxID=2593542 RepID=UPI00224A4970|nr:MULTISPECIES: glutamate-5-semialdehyde dehydrogenase [unclassified Campylobacter]MCX2682394.1 glutamate-5-semialdehyde dehydrogenase [Campylobacter sp. MIT 21-1684]MCX2750674.1 glutamate-5-semialdehyde dehydrogenase [Campylobacter sp. MIT 21-1682]MCX2806778.1 glutamate-5-semialdehyde dehydrogenase [Campylobacter sp. MIT 21-1685]
MRNLLENIKINSYRLLNLSPKMKECILLDLARVLRKNCQEILKANERDLANFTKDSPTKDRLLLDEKRIEGLCLQLESIALLEDPIGRIVKGWTNYAGLRIEKITVPIGLICVIYEARPALSAEIIALMIKSANACILKGGKEAKHTNTILFSLASEVLQKYGLEECFAMLYEKDEIAKLLVCDDVIDLLIPRGSSQMIQEIAKNTKIPLIKQDKGLCHIFIDESAPLQQAVDIVLNAKCQRPSVCNALETLLVHKNIASHLFSLLIPKLETFGVQIYAHANAFDCFKSTNLKTFLADERSFDTEWHNLSMSVKLVEDCNEAIEHINKHSSAHSEAILSNDMQNILLFQKLVDSACIYVNASTRFSDGGEFGFGGEVGISTTKLHARGPMGVEEICTYKYLITGQGQIRE